MKATPESAPASVDRQAALVAKLRYMGKQYAAGQAARGGAPQKHYLEEAADEIEMMAWALNMNEKTPGSAQENADLRNVIQAACIDGIPGLERAWAKYFPGKPITVSPGAVAQSAPLAQQASGQQTQRVHQLLGSWNEAYPRMDIHSQPGTVVMFDGRGGYEIEQKSALKMLTLRGLYTVDHVDIGGTSSTVYLTGFTRGFNTCLFAQAPVDADRAAAQVEQSMPSSEWLAEAERLARAVHRAADMDNGDKAYAMLRAHLSKRVTAQVEPVRMLTQVELTAALDLKDTFEAIQANAIRAFCRVNAGKRIPADGEVRNG